MTAVQEETLVLILLFAVIAVAAVVTMARWWWLRRRGAKVSLQEESSEEKSMVESGFLALVLAVIALVISLAGITMFLLGRLAEARRRARGAEGESLCRLEAMQQLQERLHELERSQDGEA